jgi:hypothetical protein
MQWINQPDGNDQTLVHQALVLQADEPLAPALVAFWNRILSDGAANAATSGWASLSIDIYERQSEDDSQGWMHACFLNAERRACAGVGQYYLRSDAFTLLQGEDEANAEFNRREIHWLLEQYRALKEAAHSAEVQSLFGRINAIRPLPVAVATVNGWFDLQIGEDSFGPLRGEDEAMLAGDCPSPADPLLDLIGGHEMMDVVQELNAALIEYTPPNFEIICCQITEGNEQGQRALFYDISCPQFPDDGTTVANDRVHRAATRLVQQMAPARGGFPGAIIHLEMQKDGSWRHSLKLMSQAAA